MSHCVRVDWLQLRGDDLGIKLKWAETGINEDNSELESLGLL